MRGKIIKGIAGFYYVHDGQSKIYECRAKGIFRNRNIKPLVGDDVDFTILDEENQEGNIDAIRQRHSQLIRPAVVNVDQALVIFAVTQPEPNLNLLDRFLVMMNSQDIPVSICINKTDLVCAAQLEKYRRIYEKSGCPLYFTTTCGGGQGIIPIRDLLRGRTTVLAGPSGAGKSSLTNLIQPDARMVTGHISEKIKRGRHTTRHAELIYVEKDTYLVDTPGFSSLELKQPEADRLKDYFPEFAEYAVECKFLGCVHMKEPVCGVKNAMKMGKISSERYRNYQLLYQEIKDRRRY